MIHWEKRLLENDIEEKKKTAHVTLVKEQLKFVNIKIIIIALILTAINIIISEVIGYGITFTIYSFALIIFSLSKY